MDSGPLRTPTHPLPAAPIGSETQRKPYPRAAGNLLPNISPAPFRRKRTFKEYQEPLPSAVPVLSESPPPALHKVLIQEELDKLQLVIEAGRVVDQSLRRDEQNVELESANEVLESSDPYRQSDSDFLITARHPLPPALFDKLTVARQSVPTAKIASGILPEIRRCWFSIEKRLFLWDYEQNSPLFEYAELTDPVVSVAVVPKNRELFTNKVSHMLLVSTPVEVRVYGVAPEPFFNLLRTDFAVPTNEYLYIHFAYHPNGRIFMGGTEGKVIELTYEYPHFYSSAKRYKRNICGPNLSTRLMSWFVRVTVEQLACDSSRNLLYALITCSTMYSPFQIDVYDLGANGELISLCVSIDAFSFLSRLRCSATMLMTVPPDRLALQQIFPVQRNVSLDYHLLVVLRNGIRVWVSLIVDPKEKEQLADPAMSYRPTGEYAITVTLPPISIETQSTALLSSSLRPVTVGLTSDKPSNYEQMAFLEDASLVLLERNIADMRLVTIRRSLALVAQRQGEEDGMQEPPETVSCIEDFRQVFIQCLSAVPAMNLLPSTESELCGLLPRNLFATVPLVHWLNEDVFSLRCLPSLGNVVYMPPVQFQMLTDSEWVEFTEQRPVDLLFNILEDEGQRETDKLRGLCEQFGVVHVCTMLLSLALSPSRFLRRVSPAQLQLASDRVRSKAQSLFVRLCNCQVEGAGCARERDVDEPLLALVDHQAMALYLSRVLRPIWAESVAYSDIESRSLIEHFRKPHLDAVKARLEPFLRFIEEQYPNSLSDLQHVSVLKPAYRIVPRNPTAELYCLATRTMQAIDLVLQLSEDFAFRRMVMEMRLEEQEALRMLTFKGLIASQQGHLLAKAMIEAYIRQLRTARTLKSKRMKLEEVLALFSEKSIGFFTPADAEVFLGEDALARAKLEPDPSARQDFLTAAIQRLMKNAASIAVRRVTDELLLAREVMPVISLCIKKAKDLSEIRGSAAFPEMQECYETIFLILEDVHQSLAVKDTLFVPYLCGMDLDAVARLENDILTECCKVPHKELHWALMQWLTRMNLLHKIVQLDSPHVLEFITTQFDLESYPELPLLAEYAMKAKDYKRAYYEYGRLATLRQDNALTRELIPLRLRREYLDLSLVCLETYIKDFSGNESELRKLHDERLALEQSQRLCQIQLRVQRDLMARAQAETVREWVAEAEDLDRRLLSLEELYDTVAKPKLLYEAQLELLHFHREISPTPTPETTKNMKSLFVPIIEGLRNNYWPTKAQEKLGELGKKYPYSFPVELVISHCEAINLDLAIAQPWVLALILDLQVACDFATIFEMYEDLWKENEHADRERQWLLMIRIEELLSVWVDVAEKKVFPLPAFWDSPYSGKCHIDSLTAALPAVLRLIDNLSNSTSDFNEDRRKRFSASLQTLRNRFLQLQDRLNYKAQTMQANPQQPEGESKSLQRIPAKLLTLARDQL